MPRLGSRKSRNGCVQCKARRVKCDESRPCGACTKYRVECSLLSGTTSGRRSNVLPSQARSTSREVSSSTPEPTNWAYTSSPNPSVTGLVFRPEAAPVTPEITHEQWMQDLELMHHFTAHAYLTMPGAEHTRQIWGYAVPQEAFKYPFLMHSVLAFSANHLAHINPPRASHFRLLSSTHQTAALTFLNTALTDLGPTNCHALFAGASLVVMNAFVDASTHDLDALIEIFQLLRGMVFVLHNAESWIESGPFAMIIRPCSDQSKSPPPLLSAFLINIQALACSPPQGSTPNQIACIKAAEGLRQSVQYSIESSPHPAFRAATTWPTTIDAEFLEMLRVRTDPDVQQLFKQYCKILEFASSDFWFLSGWRGISQLL
ncbi:hypothetical protein P153DRAFT_371075 [Dothidotthia symphoricarpi CBS 119687]|uniref:Zn(2)-C6 fungal-type domain-containing protein n=1 Tax=Dothidotthia symphoricarpi CBS 119687 TaxID=1392245 RepID=A0A6A5ZYV6_9PLEO|nr:uncharacterized protein P153DRAFT_371075 [Dothidotthia symphoricarpi CBS 119687]KAF2124205.1 hypothetical protein P153DRAFT_371075 [Dothidotthia symphoricarpi CBS 119687]